MTGYFKIILKFREEIDQARLIVNLGLNAINVIITNDECQIKFINRLGFSLYNNGKLTHYMSWDRYDRLCVDNPSI